MDGWKTDEAGDIVLLPLAGWQTAMSLGVGVAVRIDFLGTAEAMRTQTLSSEQYLISAQGAVELGEELARLGQAALDAAAEKQKRPPHH